MTLVCVPIMVRDTPSALADAQSARHAGADLVEYRIDDVYHGDASDEPAIIDLVTRSPLACIVTCRSAAEGGHYDGDDMARVSLYERLGTPGEGAHAPAYLDCELETYTRSANLGQKVNLAVDLEGRERTASTRLILSVHDFQGRPADLSRRLVRLREHAAARVHKIAYRARSIRDNLELFDLLAERDRPTIALGMGEFGLMSRVLAPKFGGFLTFASLRPAEATAPGQPTIADLLGLYRFRSISRSTSVYGVIGWPVSHSLSPAVHNAGFEAVGHDGVYLPLPVAAGEDPEASYAAFKATALELIEHRGLGLAGCSVTVPHKENLVRLARERGWPLDAVSAAVGAANTMVVSRHDDGSPAAVDVSNTDAPAARDALLAVAGDPRGLAVGVVGAGGAARAVAYALARAGCRVTVFNRSRARAERLASDLAAPLSDAPGSITPAGVDEAAASPCRVWVNCTPAGMKSGPDANRSALPIEEMAGPAVVMDTVYNPIRTPLLAAAQAAGWTTIDGVSMFVRQAADQFARFTGRPAPTHLFERIARESLSS